MKYSEIALKILALSECRIIKSRAQFWQEFKEVELIDKAVSQSRIVESKLDEMRQILDSSIDEPYGVCCAFDVEFPQINSKVSNGEKPYILFYKGNIELLQNLNNNVAVIGLIDPDKDIEQREIAIVNKLIEKGITVVSGLANGCDAIAHRTCVEHNAKTIALLPSTLNKIYPSTNRALAEQIVEAGGLLLSEYFSEPLNRYEATSRYVERDRLQAMFSKAVIMISSCRKGEGDSGSRHAMEYALNYSVNRYVMYNSKTDCENVKFGLNKDYVTQNGVTILCANTIEIISKLQNTLLVKSTNGKLKQLSFL